jgi:hypothetical protein
MKYYGIGSPDLISQASNTVRPSEATLGLLTVFSACCHQGQIVAVKGGQHAFQFGVRARLVDAGLQSLLGQFTNVPILAIGEIPEFNRLCDIKAVALNHFGWK